ncbi:MAG: single-stranded-DNA-specific exonuclease RecJ, partial [Clostridia bacterium]|nr:single-stranded-DNA-specific exonuclease RecJ [Clostridia bacterium]
FKAKSYPDALNLARRLDELNRLRQQTEHNIDEEALRLADSKENPYVYVLHSKAWHNGVIGIVASKLCEKFGKPCILLSEESGKYKGSGRSIDGFNLFDALADSEELLTAFGGHALAAGLSIAEENLPAFTEKINAYAKKRITADMLIPKLSVDCEISPTHITLDWANALKKFEPFGTGNEPPVFALYGAKILYANAIGANKQHLSLRIGKDGVTVNAVWFGMGAYAEELSADIMADIAFTMNINTYNGTESVQLIIKDIKKR